MTLIATRMKQVCDIEAHTTSRVSDCRMVVLPVHAHENGNLSVVENSGTFPFAVQRVYYMYDIPGGADRGGHSHYHCWRYLLAVSGSFDVTLDDGAEKKTFTLNRSNAGLLITPGIWLTMDNFSSGSVCLALASDLYDPDDYVRDYGKFLDLTASKRR